MIDFAALTLAMALAQEGIYPEPPTPRQASSVVYVTAIEPVCGNLMFPRPCHDPAVNGGCSEWDVEPVNGEWALDGTPCVYVLP